MIFNAWTFGKKVGAGFTLSALILVLVGAIGYQSTHRLVDSAGWVTHTYQVRTNLAELLSVLQDVETGYRGYVISGEDTFLEPYQAALPKIDALYSDLRKLTSDNSGQQERLDALKLSVDKKLGHAKQTIHVRRTEGYAPAAKIVLEGQGKTFMDDIRRILSDMDRQEENLLTERHAQEEHNSEMAKRAILWGSVMGILLITAIGVFITRSVTSQVGAAVRHIQNSSAELQAAANQQATGAREQSTSMNEISTTISELLATSRQIAESAQRVAHISGETVQAAKASDQTVQKTQDSFGGMKRQVDQIVTHMLDLGKKSQQIGGILEIINELAEQTNILAINASVEAADAGEEGRRFAVVADEIRKLADRVGGSTKEIRSLIEEVRAAVNTTVMATEGGSKAVEAGTRQFTEVASALQKIVALVGTSTEAAKEIELSTKQQSTAVEQVNTAIGNITQATKETETSSGQTLQTATQLTSLSRDLARMIQAANGRN